MDLGAKMGGKGMCCRLRCQEVTMKSSGENIDTWAYGMALQVALPGGRDTIARPCLIGGRRLGIQGGLARI